MFVSMSPARIRRILSTQAGVVRSVREKEEGAFVYIDMIVYIRILAEIGSLWAGDVPLRRSRYVDPTAVRIATAIVVVAASTHSLANILTCGCCCLVCTFVLSRALKSEFSKALARSRCPGSVPVPRITTDFDDDKPPLKPTIG